MFSLVRVEGKKWDEYWTKVYCANMLQSREYGNAKHRSSKWLVSHFLLADEVSAPQGLLQVLHYSIPYIGGMARINRGPVFFSGCRDSFLRVNYMEEVLDAVLRTARKYRWWYLSISPNLVAADESFSMLRKLGFKRKSPVLYGSALVSIDKEPEQIQAGFHGKWRNLLKKSEKMGLQVVIPQATEGLSYLTEVYKELQKEKNFKGISQKLINGIFEEKGPTWRPQIFYAAKDGRYVGGVLVVGHGDTCTYLVGWTPPEGRELQSNYFLLWQAILYFRNLGCRFFDVGGLSETTESGIAHFKQRLQGQPYSLVGEHYFIPNLLSRRKFKG